MSIDWKNVNRVLIVRLRSIGDTVLATPSLISLKRFLPYAEVDILLEDWVAPVLEGFENVTNIITTGKETRSRISAARTIRKRKYDVVINLHGGTTSTWFTIAAGAKHRVGYSNYRYAYAYNHRLSSASEYWEQKHTHSAEQQLALLGHVGVPVEDRPPSRLTVTKERAKQIEERLAHLGIAGKEIALIHPAAAFDSKTWPAERFAAIVDLLTARGLYPILTAGSNEQSVVDAVRSHTSSPLVAFTDLQLPDVTALSVRSRIFIGNDSGIAHIAAAVGTPTVVIFGSSNREHWRPWTMAPNKIVYEEFACQPCPGYECKEFGEPKCILNIPVEKVATAADSLL